MEDMQNFESTNINSLWLQNIYENLKNLEYMERMAREGCENLMDYLQMPYEQKKIIIADIQFKNLRMMITEINLLLTDLTPVMDADEIKDIRTSLENIDKIMQNRKLFVIEKYSVTQNKIMASSTTPLFWDTVSFINMTRVKIIKSIAHLLYVKEEDYTKPKKKW